MSTVVKKTLPITKEMLFSQIEPFFGKIYESINRNADGVLHCYLKGFKFDYINGKLILIFSDLSEIPFNVVQGMLRTVRDMTEDEATMQEVQIYNFLEGYDIDGVQEVIPESHYSSNGVSENQMPVKVTEQTNYDNVVEAAKTSNPMQFLLSKFDTEYTDIDFFVELELPKKELIELLWNNSDQETKDYILDYCVSKVELQDIKKIYRESIEKYIKGNSESYKNKRKRR